MIAQLSSFFVRKMMGSVASRQLGANCGSRYNHNHDLEVVREEGGRIVYSATILRRMARTWQLLKQQVNTPVSQGIHAQKASILFTQNNAMRTKRKKSFNIGLKYSEFSAPQTVLRRLP
ncbi:hypothetical protein [Janthinobacterium sp. YR213]|uniref:hypothetical protein n=1 Tax=Janthinobacterium sp. YR213 TaxID=1881027 RepID=UPI0011144FBB|nr:hypothetical protein [Janthinobacterium sp. YR213]